MQRDTVQPGASDYGHSGGASVSGNRMEEGCSGRLDHTRHDVQKRDPHPDPDIDGNLLGSAVADGKQSPPGRGYCLFYPGTGADGADTLLVEEG